MKLKTASEAHRTVATILGAASPCPANQVLVYQYLITFIGVTSGVMLLGEGLGVEKIIGGAITLFGVYLARRQ